MKVILATTIVLLFTACAAPGEGKHASLMEEQKHASLMDEVEKQVQLPKGAQQLDDYARYYSLHEGKIYGFYVIPDESEPESLAAGQRRWVEGFEGIEGGYGCSVVDVLFNPATHKVEEAYCGGDL